MQHADDQQSDESLKVDPKEILHTSSILDMRSDPKSSSSKNKKAEKTIEDKSGSSKPSDVHKDPETILQESDVLDMREIATKESDHKTMPLSEIKKSTSKKVSSNKTQIDPNKAKILFFGTPQFSVPVLQKLVEEGYTVIGVVTQPDRKKNNNKKPSASPVKEYATKKGLAVYQPESLKKEFLEMFKELSPDLVVTAAYGKIMPQQILKQPPYQAINVHPSLLPKYRGASPIQNALLDDLSTTGTTIMVMDEGMDTGAIIKQGSIDVGEDELYEDLALRLSELSAQMLLDILPDWLARKITPTEQQSKEATHCQLIEKEDGQIYWNEAASDIYNKYRAFHEWPGIYAFWKSGHSILRLKFIDIEFHEQEEGSQNTKKKFGDVYAAEDDIVVQAQNGVIILKEVQLEGKKANTIDEFLKGHPDFLNSKLQ